MSYVLLSRTRCVIGSKSFHPKPVKRRGNRRYYQRHDVELIRTIRGLLYEQGFTIGGARQKLEGDAAGTSSGSAGNISLAMLAEMRAELESVLELLKAR